MKTIYLGGGGFWTIEAIYKRVKGVVEVTPGYMGGTIPNPTHEAVGTGTTDHAEVIKVIYDEGVIDTHNILRLFFAAHDASIPTHVANGIRSQYRSVIFYTDDLEGEANTYDNGEHVGVIRRIMEEVQTVLPAEIPLSTQSMTATEFYPADESHYDFYNNNPDSAYSVTIIAPKIKEVVEKYPQYFKES